MNYSKIFSENKFVAPPGIV